jgi:hypothetical protein
MTRESKDKDDVSRRKRKLIYAFLTIIVVLIPLVYFYSAATTKQEKPRAAIVDQLSSSKLGETIRNKNATFVEAVEHLLQERFSMIDYYSDNATVEQYVHLASLGYRLIVWRGHSALDPSGYVALASTDKYGLKDYDTYLENDQLALCNITGDASLYFGITPRFIEQVMGGRFTDTVIFLMSCNGLNEGYLKTAQAFENKGAKAVISWDNWVSSFDNDGAADILLQYLINENNTIGQAVSRMPLYSPDYGWAELKYYPPETSDYYIPDYRQSTAQAVATTILPMFKKGREQKSSLETSRAWISQPSEVSRNSQV